VKKSDAGDRLALRDGAEVVIRPIRPTDKDRLKAAFETLGKDSRRMRFLSHKSRLTRAELAYLTEVDHTDHEALLGIDPGTHAIVGVARYVRLAAGSERAEAAVVVADGWQRRGLATGLLSRLAERARHAGIRGFAGTALAENRPVIELLRRLRTARCTSSHGVLEFVVELD
jgi:GNAT superfamily N-acetyltransferase